MLGLSGGGDSTALLHLLAELGAADRREVYAFVVNHNLRPGAKAEADTAWRAARTLGANAQVLHWQQPKPGQRAARLQRHAMLARACRDAGARTLFLAHTLEDRIETLAMRLARASGGRGLTAMGELDPSPVWPEGRGVLIARPLIASRRAGLRGFLRSRGAGWVEDPSNADRRYERVRLRQSGLVDDDRFCARLLTLGDLARGLEQSARRDAARLLDRAARPLAWGGLALDRASFNAAPPLVAQRAIEMAMLAVSGAPDLPGPSRVCRLLGALGQATADTAGGVMLDAKGRLGRDPGAASGRADGTPGPADLYMAPGEEGVFDGRLSARATQQLVIEPAGRGEAEGLGDAPPPFLAGLPVVRGVTGERLAVTSREAARYGTFGFLIGDRLRHLAFPFAGATWFDGV